MRKHVALSAFMLAFLVAVLAGRWGKALFTTSEFVHFSVNFPTNGNDATLPVSELGGPWARLERGQWPGYPRGGVLVWGLEGKITVDLGQQGWIKELVQPRSIGLSTHWLRNVGTIAYDISLELDMCGLPTRWITFERTWNPEHNRLERSVPPGETANMDWEITVPEEHYRRAVICEGALTVRDSSTSRALTRLPIDIINTGGGAS